MKRFVLKIAVFLVVFSLLYLVFFYAVDKGLKSSDYVDYAEWNDIYEGEINAELVIMGSSRAWRQVDPSIIDQKLSTTSFNLGIDGFHFPMQIGKYKVYNEHNRAPEKMIYIVDHFSFDKREDLFNKNQFLPYIEDTLLARYLKTYVGFNWEHYNIPYFQYSGSKEVCLAGFSEFINLRDFKGTKIKGFQAQEKVWEPGFDREKKMNPKGKRTRFSKQVIEDFDKFIGDAKHDGIEIVLVYSPEYYEFQSYTTNRDTIIGLYELIAGRHDIPFLDYSDHKLCYSKDYFYNPTHLNKVGATKFTEDLAERLKDMYKYE